MKPASNNGTKGGLNYMLQNPPQILEVQEGKIDLCKVAGGTDHESEDLGCSPCSDQVLMNIFLMRFYEFA